MKPLKFLVITLMAVMMTCSAYASSMTGGDAADQASASSVLDIVFVTDTSGSMYGDINAIGTQITGVLNSLECPDCDVWIRAQFMGITGTYGSVFNESLTTVLAGNSLLTNHLEDNGPAVTDLVNYYNWNDDTTASQNYYKAVVTIGDEGTENGYGVDSADWAAALLANQTAIANDVMVFSYVAHPYSGVPELFEALAEGGTNPYGGADLGDTGGKYILYTGTSNAELDAVLTDILCTAGTGGTNNNPVPEPATMILFGLGLLGLARVNRKK